MVSDQQSTVNDGRPGQVLRWPVPSGELPGQRSGLTLVELLLFVGIVVIMVGAIVSFSLVSNQVGIRADLTAEVEQNGNMILQYLVRQIQSASRVLEPVRGSSSNTLVLLRLDESFDPLSAEVQHQFHDRLRTIEITDTTTPSFLTSRKVSLEDLTFLHFGEGEAEGVSFAFRIVGKHRGLPRWSRSISRTFRGTALLLLAQCSTDSDCSAPERCCDGVCRQRCLTVSCTSDDECEGAEICCLTDLPLGTVTCAGASACKCETLEDCPGQQPRCNLARCEYEVPRCSGGSCTWEVVGKCDECSVCGDRWLDSVRGEECDDGDTDNTDKCTNTCKLASCGDAILQPRGADGANGGGDDEVCDDGNRSDNDGCSSVCTVETPPSCGNGIVEGEEECDQGVANSNTMPNRCRTNCRNFHCGDNVRDTGEECDDGNHLFRDGCSGSCRDEDASRACGNGILEDPEDCDDGKRCTNTGDPCFLASDCSGGICSAFNGDGCSTTCTREVLCGDGKRGGSEVCDDGGVCRGSSVVAYNGRLCTELDLQGNPLDGVQRCIATGGTCVPESSGGCQSNCLRRCRTRGEICFTDADCNEPDSAGCAVCVNGACEPY